MRLVPSSKSRRVEHPVEWHWNSLNDLLQGRPAILYHGTTRQFTNFDLGKVRKIVRNFRGIFLTPEKHLATQYAEGDRNAGLPITVVDDLKHRNQKAGIFLGALVKQGRDAWNRFTPEALGVRGEAYIHALERAVGGVDANLIQDVADHIVGSKTQRHDDDLTQVLKALQATSGGLSDWVYGDLDKLGVDSTKYRPKVYTVEARAKKVFVTTARSEARTAQRRGYDGVLLYGPDTSDSVPEVVLFDPSQVRIVSFEVV